MTIIAGPPESTVKRLLSEAELPTSDITSEKLQPFAEPFFRRLGYERIAREVAPLRFNERLSSLVSVR